MHLDRAAALNRVGECTVDELCASVIEIAIGGDIPRVFPTKLEVLSNDEQSDTEFDLPPTHSH